MEEKMLGNLLEDIRNRNKKAIVIAVAAVTGGLIWVILTLTLAGLVADVQIGQLRALLLVVDVSPQKSAEIAASLVPTAKLGGFFYALAAMWGIPYLVAAYIKRWWPFQNRRW